VTKQMINPSPYIKLVDALNEVEAAVKEAAKRTDGRLSLSGIVFHSTGKGSFGTELDMGAHYSIQYDSEADRWALVSETDDAPNLCSFNQTEDECSEIDPCEQCHQAREALEDADDAHRDYFN
jgi:hypothetical protein